jgi:hypothetical protein
MKKELQIILIVSFVYLFIILLFISFFNFNFSSLALISERISPINTFPKGIVVFSGINGYDGQYFYNIALNPFDPNNFTYSFRFQRILYPLIVYLFSLGFKEIIPFLMLFVNFVSILISTFFIILILKKHNARLEWAYLWAFNPAFLVGLTRDLAEPLLGLFLVLFIYFLEEKRIWLSSIILCFAVLTKEITLLILLPLLIYTLFKKRFRDFLIFLIPLLIFIIWQICLFLIFGKFGLGTNSTLVGIPLNGLFNYLVDYTKINNIYQFPMMLSSLPAILFCLVCFYFLFKEKELSLYKLLLFFNIIFILSLTREFYSLDWIEAIGRQAIGVYLFSIIYFSKKRHNLIIPFSFLFAISWIDYVFRLFLIPFLFRYFIS